MKQSMKVKTQSRSKKQSKRQKQKNSVPGDRNSATMRAPPLAVGFAMRTSLGQNRQKVRISGLLGSAIVNSNTPIGATLFEILLNPLMWDNTRVQLESQLWQQFRFTKLSLTVKPGVPTICSGAYAHGHDNEPETLGGSGQNLVNYVSYLPGAAYANIWQPSTATCSVGADMRSQMWFKLENTEPNKPDYCQGYYIVTLAEKFAGATGNVSLSVWADGEIEFAGRRMPLLTAPKLEWNAGQQYSVSTTGELDILGYSAWTTLLPDNAVFEVVPQATLAANSLAGPDVNFVRRFPGAIKPTVYSSLGEAISGQPGDQILGDATIRTMAVDVSMVLSFAPPTLAGRPGIGNTQFAARVTATAVDDQRQRPATERTSPISTNTATGKDDPRHGSDNTGDRGTGLKAQVPVLLAAEASIMEPEQQRHNDLIKTLAGANDGGTSFLQAFAAFVLQPPKTVVQSLIGTEGESKLETVVSTVVPEVAIVKPLVEGGSESHTQHE
jgi:hypothetical protein